MDFTSCEVRIGCFIKCCPGCICRSQKIRSCFFQACRIAKLAEANCPVHTYISTRIVIIANLTIRCHYRLLRIDIIRKNNGVSIGIQNRISIGIGKGCSCRTNTPVKITISGIVSCPICPSHLKESISFDCKSRFALILKQRTLRIACGVGRNSCSKSHLRSDWFFLTICTCRSGLNGLI